MATFTQRTEAPATSNRYYYTDNIFYQSGYGLPNCTCYAFGRFWEIKGGSAPSLSWGNAEEWYGHTSDGYERGQTPKLGAVICWRKGVAGDNSDGAGHVEVVEAINADGTIITSGSGYNSFLFRRMTRSNDGNWGGGSAYTFQGFIYNPVTFDIPGGNDSEEFSNELYIWRYFMEKIGNEYGVAALMGNLYAESGLYPDRVQGDIPYSSYSQEYTAKVDSGALSRYDFTRLGPGGGGYGLCQWTFYTRKEGLYDMWKSGGYSSIGAIDLACDYLWHELQVDFKGVLNVLKTATGIRVASDKVLHDFENPANQSEAVEKKRCDYGVGYYEKYAGTSGPLPDIPGTTPDDPCGVFVKKKKMGFLLMLAATRRRL